MKRLLYIGLVLFVPILLVSCATILSGRQANVTVQTSTGEKAKATVDGETFFINGPTKIKVDRGFKKSIITAENETSEGSVEVKKGFNPVTLGNILLGGVIGLAVDGATGAMTKPKEKVYTIAMQPRTNAVVTYKPANQVEGLGNTSLEEQIVRWDIQSRPQGADIFWRVVSKTPEVKNTNNKYLMTTPYEATKSIDIKGLTNQTAGDVRIIIRCEKDGYHSQEKEFNVRTIIDQEEISAFFRLVKEE